MKKFFSMLVLTVFISTLYFGFMVQPLIQSVEANPGQEVEVEFQISATTTTPEDVNLVAKGVYVDPEGNGWKFDDTYERSFAKWITLPETLKILPGDKTTQKFKIAVPTNAVGSYLVALNFTSGAPVTSGQVAYRINYVAVVWLVVKGSGNKQPIKITNTDASVVKENGEFKGVKISITLDNPSDWAAAVIGKIDVVSKELKKTPISLKFDGENAQIITAKKSRTLTFVVDKIIPPSNYDINMTFEYSYKDYYSGRFNAKSNLQVAADFEKDRKELFLASDPKELYIKLEKKSAGSKIVINQVNTSLNLINNDYIDIDSKYEINNDFTPQGFQGIGNYGRLIDTNAIKVSGAQVLKIRSFSDQPYKMNLNVNYRNADPTQLSGEYYGNLILNASGVLNTTTLTKKLTIPILIDFGDNKYTFAFTKPDVTLSADKKTANIGMRFKNDGNSRIPFEVRVIKFDDKNQAIGDAVRLFQKNTIYPSCEFELKGNFQIEDNIKKLTFQIQHQEGLDKNGAPLLKTDTIDVNIK